MDFKEMSFSEYMEQIASQMEQDAAGMPRIERRPILKRAAKLRRCKSYQPPDGGPPIRFGQTVRVRVLSESERQEAKKTWID